MSCYGNGPYLYDSVSEVNFGPRCRDEEEANHLCFKASQIYGDARKAGHDQLVEVLHQLRKEQLGAKDYRKVADEALREHKRLERQIYNAVHDARWKGGDKNAALSLVLDNLGKLGILAEELEAS